MSRITPGAHHLAGELSQLGAHLELSGDRLLCHIPSRQQLPAKIAARIRDHKQQLISYLHHISRANKVPDFAFSEHPVLRTFSFFYSGQASICLHEHVYPSNDFYVMSTALRISGPLNVNALSQIRKTWQLELPLRFLFESLTVALLSMRIEQENLAHECVEI